MTEQPAPGRDPDILTTLELAGRLGLSEQTVRRMANAGQIPAMQTGKDWRYYWPAVLEVLRTPHPRADEGGAGRGSSGKRRGAGRSATRRARTAAQPDPRDSDETS